MNQEQNENLPAEIVIKATWWSGLGVFGYFAFVAALALFITALPQFVGVLFVTGILQFLHQSSMVVRVIACVGVLVAIIASYLMLSPAAHALATACLGLAIGSIWLVGPSAGGWNLTLRRDGFSITHLWKTRYFVWSDWKPEVQWSASSNAEMFILKYVGATRNGAVPSLEVAPKLYGLTSESLAALMNRFRNRVDAAED